MEGRIPKKKKKKKRFGLFMQQNLLLVFVVVVLMFVALIVRLVYLNYNDGDRYERRVLSQQTYVSNAIAYRRGAILDRNGTVLAESIRVYNMIIDPVKMLSKKEYLEPTLKALETCFSINPEEITAILEAKPNSQYVVFEKSIVADKVEAFEAMQEDDENIEGVWFEDDYKRVYPNSSLACDVVGFTSSGTSTGIESFYNDELTGEDGRSYGYFDSELNLERVVKPATDGNTIVSTLDANIQQIVEQKVAAFNKEIGSSNTAVLVMKPQNGEILAMTSGQQYDLNNPKDLTSFYSKKEIKAMSEEEELEALNKIWRNFVVSDTFEPGSTFKPITVAAALEEGLVKEKSKFYCGGAYNVSGVRIRCASRTGHGSITLQQSLMYSCNSALMQIVEKLGASSFYKYQTNFMFGSKTGIDLPAETSGYIFKEENLGPTELATSSFGQGFNCSMLQIAASISSLINGGYYYEPHVLKEIQSTTGATIESSQEKLVKKTVSGDTSEKIRRYLFQTVENGTATLAQVEGYTVGGKTGTAEKLPRGSKKYLVSFIGFAPAEEPEVLIYALVDEPAVEDQAHSTYASQLFHDIAEAIFPFLGIPQTAVVEKSEEDEATKNDDAQDDVNGSTNNSTDNNASDSGTNNSNSEQGEDAAGIDSGSDTEEGTTPEGQTAETVGDESGIEQDDIELPAVDENTGDSNIIE